jgi:hypothetical protein
LPGGKEVKDVVWYYENPTLESMGVKDLYCFYPDKVKTWVDGEEIERIGMGKKMEQVKNPTGKAGLEGENGQNNDAKGKEEEYLGKACNC